MSEIILKSKEIPQEVPVVSVGEYILSKLNRLPDKTCIVEFKTGNELTTKQLIYNSERLAVSLLNKGIVKSDVFMCFSQNNLQYAITEFAFFLLGNTFTPVKPTNGVFELKNHIRDSGTTVIFTSVLNANKVKKVLNNNQNLKHQIKFVVVFDGKCDDFLTFDELINEAKSEKLERIPFFEVNPKEDLVTIVYTSGTTGLPKGAMITHYGYVSSLIEGIFLTESEKSIRHSISCYYPLGHVGGTFVIPFMISIGHKVVIYDSINEEEILRSVTKYKIEHLVVSQSLGYRLMDNNLKYDISSVKLMLTGGSRFPANIAKGLIEKFGIIFREAYGMTEFLFPTTYGGPLGSVGNVSPISELKIIDLTTGQSLGPNIDGEICIRGPKLFKGYLNNEKATKEAIDSNGWYHTGDIGHYDQNQFVYITDRLKELIKYRTWSVAPAEVEAFLHTHESVESVAVIGVNHKIDGQLPRAFVKVKNGHKVDEQELINAVKENMAFQNQIRGGIVFVDEIPKTMIGKVDRQFFKKIVEKEFIE